jgi:hypothetical protein
MSTQEHLIAFTATTIAVSALASKTVKSSSGLCGIGVALWGVASAGFVGHPIDSTWPLIAIVAGQLLTMALIAVYRQHFVWVGSAVPTIVLAGCGYFHLHLGYMCIAIAASVGGVIVSLLLYIRHPSAQADGGRQPAGNFAAPLTPNITKLRRRPVTTNLFL